MMAEKKKKKKPLYTLFSGNFSKRQSMHATKAKLTSDHGKGRDNT